MMLKLILNAIINPMTIIVTKLSQGQELYMILKHVNTSSGQKLANIDHH